MVLTGPALCSQVPRILNPLVLVLEGLPAICKDPKLAAYVQSVWGGAEQCWYGPVKPKCK